MLNRLGSRLYTIAFGKRVGTDAYGNRYYTHKKNKCKRWVLYNGVNDPSKVPVNWHIWLHSSDQEPMESKEITWMPNCTGTEYSHRYTGNIANIPKTELQCYEAWIPKPKH